MKIVIYNHNGRLLSASKLSEVVDDETEEEDLVYPICMVATGR
jgi:hypothetical protein